MVATDVGACPEMLAEEPAARLCRRENVDAIANALKELLAMRVDRKALSARHAVRYSWQRQAEIILGLIGSGKREEMNG